MSLIFSRNGEEVTLKAPTKEVKGVIQSRIEEGRKLLQIQILNESQLKEALQERDKWHYKNTVLIEKYFTGKAILHDYDPQVGAVIRNRTFGEKLSEYVNETLEWISNLELIIELLDVLEEESEDAPPIPVELPEPQPKLQEKQTGKVFLVHGHDIGAKETVARFLEKIGIETIILAEKVNGGSITIVEKFIREAEGVNFAVVLFTPDDVGGLNESEEKKTEVRERARQNVILELGYFLAKVGRENVVVLKKGDIEIPTDYSGVIYIPFDEHDGWHLKLAGELQKANIAFDASKLLPS